VVAALYALMQEKKVTAKTLQAAIKQYGINPDKPHPMMG
jgi:pyruvate dehydrogenase complex dehydrogenase (E1) component